MFIYKLLGFVLILFVGCKLSSRFQYYAKFTFFLLGTAISALIFPYPSLLFYPIRDYRIGLLSAWGFRKTVNLLGLKYEVRGIENLDRNEGGVIVVAPHQSGIDLAVTAYLWPIIGRGVVIIKRLLLYAFPFGIGVWLCGTLFIDRNNKEGALSLLKMQLEAIQKRFNKIVIFPEGTRSQDGTILPFKKGAFHLAIDSQSMVQPVVVSRYHFLSSKEKRFGEGKIIISILPAIQCKGMTKDDVSDLTNSTKLLMDKHFAEISKETKAYS
ncbi:putative 1-acyl-sn-glycerol-3-phosphate acyltransferase acl-2 [Pseudolycoriella hygida]|uniref:1-acylglycerol-3-phosphate O-acyltransferase n=1 Tax=Pseudolycoriella hygida TaxID=35572 RepID=A0A9Q0N6I5_9DIPT|nr:putative 1-acyl-sn-glycerol-3-phosphate acyltransferase acl-2 [Pseudolycoriella hygida]